MGSEEIRELCVTALQLAPLHKKHPLTMIFYLLLPLGYKKIEFDSAYLKCHQWLFSHRQETTFIISNPDKRNNSGAIT